MRSTHQLCLFLFPFHQLIAQDISYYCCVEVSGKQGDVISSVSPLFSSDTGELLIVKSFANGTRFTINVVLEIKGVYYSRSGIVKQYMGTTE